MSGPGAAVPAQVVPAAGAAPPGTERARRAPSARGPGARRGRPASPPAAVARPRGRGGLRSGSARSGAAPPGRGQQRRGGGVPSARWVCTGAAPPPPRGSPPGPGAETRPRGPLLPEPLRRWTRAGFRGTSPGGRREAPGSRQKAGSSGGNSLLGPRLSLREVEAQTRMWSSSGGRPRQLPRWRSRCAKGRAGGTSGGAQAGLPPGLLGHLQRRHGGAEGCARPRGRCGPAAAARRRGPAAGAAQQVRPGRPPAALSPRLGIPRPLGPQERVTWTRDPRPGPLSRTPGAAASARAEERSVELVGPAVK